jgi:hypothetical protein
MAKHSYVNFASNTLQRGSEKYVYPKLQVGAFAGSRCYHKVERQRIKTDVPEFSAVLRAIHERYQLIGINAEFQELEPYKQALPASAQKRFGLFGNTPGCKADQTGLLRCISNALSSDDIFIAEIQLLESDPPSDAELLRRFATTKNFYLGPFLTLGCSESELELGVKMQSSPDYITVNIICRVAKKTTTRVEAFDNLEITIPEGEYCALQIRKYKFQSLERIFRKAELEVVDSYSRSGSQQAERVFAYIAARKSAQRPDLHN